MELSDRIYEYMPDDEARDQSNRGKYNCSESMLLAINDKYDLHISEDAKTQMAAFGGGLFMGDVCGLLIGGYAALAHMFAEKENPKANDKLKSVCKEWYSRFSKEFNTINCINIKPETGGCSGQARAAAKVFESLMRDIE